MRAGIACRRASAWRASSSVRTGKSFIIDGRFSCTPSLAEITRVFIAGKRCQSTASWAFCSAKSYEILSSPVSTSMSMRLSAFSWARSCSSRRVTASGEASVSLSS